MNIKHINVHYILYDLKCLFFTVTLFYVIIIIENRYLIFTKKICNVNRIRVLPKDNKLDNIKFYNFVPYKMIHNVMSLNL